MTLAVDVLFSASAWTSQRRLEALAQRTVRQCADSCGVAFARNCEVSVNFCDDATIRILNARWRGVDSATNVLSFPTPGPLNAKLALGDIVIAFETVAREAQLHDKSLIDHATHMIIHGFLHLIGYDHENRRDAEQMEALERSVALALGLPDPYGGMQPVDDESRRDHINSLLVDDD